MDSVSKHNMTSWPCKQNCQGKHCCRHSSLKPVDRCQWMAFARFVSRLLLKGTKHTPAHAYDTYKSVLALIYIIRSERGFPIITPIIFAIVGVRKLTARDSIWPCLGQQHGKKVNARAQHPIARQLSAACTECMKLFLFD